MDYATESRVKDYTEQSALDYAKAVVMTFGRLDLDNGVSRIYLCKPEPDEAPYRRNGDPAFHDGLHILEPTRTGPGVSLHEGVLPGNQSLPFCHPSSLSCS